MQWFYNLQMRAKLLASFCFMLLLTTGLGLFALNQLGRVNEVATEIKENWLPGVQHVLQLRGLLSDFRCSEIQHILSTDDKDMRRYEQQMDKQLEAIKKEQTAYESLISSPEEKQIYTVFTQLWQDYLREHVQVIALSQKNQNAEARALTQGKAKELYDAVIDKMEEDAALNHKGAEEASRRGDALYASARWVIWTCLSVVLALGIGVALVLARLITRPLEQTVTVLQAVVERDLTQRLAVDTQDEAGQMAKALNEALTNLGQTIAMVGHNAQTLAGASEELTSVSQQMSANSEETAAQAGVVSAAGEQVSKNIQTVAAGAEEMTASIKEIAKNASDAARIASQAVQAAQTTTRTITQLGVSSQEIGNVIKVITSIAEQTNLLALNATIEAARAGEAGKGFAVVANEVKELAKQTAEATEEISSKITAIQSDTQGAVTAVEQISGIINQVNDIANTIASAVEEQSVTTSEMARNVEEASKGSAEIAQNVTGVAQAAQSTASGATETQASAQELSRMAVELQRLVSQFKVEATEGRSAHGTTVRGPATMPVGVRSHVNGYATEAQF